MAAVPEEGQIEAPRAQRAKRPSAWGLHAPEVENSSAYRSRSNKIINESNVRWLQL